LRYCLVIIKWKIRAILDVEQIDAIPMRAQWNSYQAQGNYFLSMEIVGGGEQDDDPLKLPSLTPTSAPTSC